MKLMLLWTRRRKKGGYINFGQIDLETGNRAGVGVWDGGTDRPSDLLKFSHTL
jgi:hypothetical protein